MKKVYLLLLMAFILESGYLKAQESIMDSYSNVYLEKLIATAKENYPRINALKSRVIIAQSALTSQKSAWLDGLSFNYVYKPDNTLDIVNPTFFNGYQVSVSFSINSLFQKSGNVKQAKEAVKITRYDQDEYNLTLEAQIKARYITYILQDGFLKLQYRIYNDAKTISEDANLRYQKGVGTLTDYIQAQTALNAAIQARMGAEASRMSAKASLEELTVKKLEEIQ